MRMTIDEEISIGRVFVLAYTAFENRSTSQVRNTFAQIGPSCAQSRFSYHPLPTVRIELRTMFINGNLKTALLKIRDRVRLVIKVYPNGCFVWTEPLVTRGCAKKEFFLTCDMNPLPENFGKKSGQPRSTGEDKLVGNDSRRLSC